MMSNLCTHIVTLIHNHVVAPAPNNKDSDYIIILIFTLTVK